MSRARFQKIRVDGVELNYRQYLQTPAWKQKRQAAILVAGGTCQMCDAGPPLQVHHRTYARVGQELPGDLTVLCAGCHYRHHHRPRVTTKADYRKQIDEQILAIVGAAGAISWKEVRPQLPRGPGVPGVWARCQKLIKTRQLKWVCGGKLLALYSRDDLTWATRAPRRTLASLRR